MKPHRSLNFENGHDIINAGLDITCPKTATNPVDAPPGSLEKLETMRDRVARCEELFSEEDRQGFDGIDPRSLRTFHTSPPKGILSLVGKVGLNIARDPHKDFAGRTRSH